MKILIGTPIHESKDYCMERWLKNVSRLQQKYPADLLLVDNSQSLNYVEKVHQYCKKYGIKNYQIKYLGIDQKLGKDIRIGVSQETIRQYILISDYDGWFSWECDQIIPTNALGKLVQLMKTGNFMIVAHNCWIRESPDDYSTDMGCTLIKREVLQKYEFIRKDASGSWLDDDWFNGQVLRGGGNFIEVYGIIDPIYHLDK